MRKNIKRVIAGVLSAVLSLSLVNFSALSVSFASELSGYEIGVEYSEDNTSATLVGNTTGVKEGVQLDKLVDSEGQELDPASFSQTVEENGTYHFTLYYQEAVDTQGADQPTTEEKTQKLEVVVNGIGKPKADQPAPTATPEVQEGVVMGGEAEKNGPPPFAEKEESMTAAPRTVPLDLLQRSTAQARASKTVHIYANEAEFKLQEVAFSGGPLVAGADGLPQVDSRTFAKADYIINGTTITRAINGLYTYNNKWYYTVDGNTVNGGDAGTLYVGFELPSNATVRLHYKIANTQDRTLNFSGVNGDLAKDFKLSLNGKQTYTNLQYPQGTKVVLEFSWPVTLKEFNINIPGVGKYNITSAQKLGNNALTEEKIWETSDQRYTLIFSMPPQDVNATFNGTLWTDADRRNFAIGSDFTPESGESFNNTAWQENPTVSGSFFESIPYDKYNSPGIVTNAKVSHRDGGMDYTWPSTFQVYDQGGSNTKEMQFAQGDFKSNQMVGFKLRMDRSKNDYTWKPTSLVMNVYIGQSYDANNKNFHQYNILLAHTTGLTTGSTRDTYLDCGARVRTVCYEWDEDAYYYRIYVYNMTHNFTLYDRPAKTNQESFLIAGKDAEGKLIPGLEGIKTTSFGENFMDGSYASNINGPYSGAPIRPNADFQAAWLQGAGTLGIYQKYFFIRPKYGYTAPTEWIENKLNQTVLVALGQVKDLPGLYQFTMQVETTDKGWATKTPTLINFTAKPLKFNVGYYSNGNVGSTKYKDVFQMTAEQNTSYAITEAKDPSAGNQKLKGYRVKFQTTYYENRVEKTVDVPIPPPSDPTNVDAYWYPNKDVLTFSWVYDYLQSKGMTTVNETTALRIVPQYATDDEAAVQAQLEVKEQTKFAELDNNSTDNRNLTENVNATSTKKDINAYLGSTVSLYGNKKQYQKGTKKYLYNETASRPVGTVTAENRIVASLEYLLATAVTVDTNTLGTEHNYDSWKSTIEGKWFTSVNNFDHSFTLTGNNGLNPGTKQGETFTGWGIRRSTGEIVAVTNNMMWNNNLNFYMIGTANLDLWSDIFDTGSCTLVAMWASNVAKVTTAGGTTIVDQTGTTVEVMEGQKTMVMSAAFRYANPSVTQQELQALADANQLKVALVKKDPSGTGGWQVRSFDNSQTAGFSRPSITALTNGDFQISFTFTQMSGEQEVELDPTYNDGANFRIFAWTSENAGTDGLTASTICSQLNAAEAATSEENPYVNPYENIVPSVRVPISMLYKVKSADGTSITNKPGTDVEIYGRASSFTISGSFQYGDTTASLNEIQKLYNDGKLKIALIKQNPTGGDWQKRVFGNDATNGFSTPVMTGTGSTLKVTFTVSANPIDPQWNDGAKFRIFVWTAANDGGQDLTADGICTALNGASGGNPYDNKIPSVNVQTTMLFKVFSSDGTNITNRDKNLEILDGADSFTLTAEFKYGDTAVTQEKLDALFKNEKLKIGLLKMNPPSSENRAWAIRYGDGDETFGKPTITKTGGSSNFTVSFTVNNAAITGQNNDGASFRILVWTDANDKKADGGSWTITDIMNTLNSAAGENPYDTKLASVTTNTTMLYKVVNDTVSSGSVTVMSTSENITLTGAFKYQYDTNRYSDGFTTENLTQLITDGKIQVKLQKQMKDSSEWVVVPGMDKNALTAGENGAINFNYAFTETGASWANYDGAKFKVTLWTAANGTAETAYPFYTITVTYVADPTAYVDIPKYIILDDNNSNVKNGDVKQDGYAGKQVEVKYNDTTMNAAFKPSIEVKVQDGVLLKEGSISGKPMADMAIGIYDTNGGKISADQGYCSVGTLSATQTSLPFWMNVKRGTVKNQQYYATVMFVLELSGTIA